MFPLSRLKLQLPLLLNLDGGGTERAHVVCGFLGCDSRPFNPLLESLPRILHIRGSGADRSAWLNAFTRFALMEANEKRAGGTGTWAGTCRTKRGAAGFFQSPNSASSAAGHWSRL